MKPVKGGQMNVRLTEAEVAKLETMKKETNLTGSQLIRGFLNDGKINVRYDQKKVIQQMTQMHDDFNTSSRHVIEQIKQTQNIMSNLTAACKKNHQGLDSAIEMAKYLLQIQLYEYEIEYQKRVKELKDIVNL